MAICIEREFHREMAVGVERLKCEIGYNPVRFTQMMAEHRGHEAARQLLRSNATSDRFATLWEANRLEMSIEAAALLPWYQSLFLDEHRAVARKRLLEQNFAVDEFLKIQTNPPPRWTCDH